MHSHMQKTAELHIKPLRVILLPDMQQKQYFQVLKSQGLCQFGGN